MRILKTDIIGSTVFLLGAVVLKWKPGLWMVIACLVISIMAQAQTSIPSSMFNKVTEDKGAIVAGIIYDLDSKKTVEARNEFTRMTPASLSKIFTSAAAVDQLGAGYRFQTHIYVSGHVENGILFGDLIVKGGGDPTLGSRFFSNMQGDSVLVQIFQAIKNAGIKHIKGRILVEAEFFDLPQYPSLRLWEDMGNYYGSAPRSLSYKDNSFELTLKSPSKLGQVCEVVSVKPSCDLDFTCRVKSAASKRDSAYIYGHPGMKKWYIEGSIPAGRSHFVIKGAMPYPEQVFIRELDEFLASEGVVVERCENIATDEALPGREIWTIRSPRLSEIIKVVNKQSNNLYADHLFLALAKNNGAANWTNAQQTQLLFWSQVIGCHSIYLHDGSGLSPFNHCSVTDLVRVLSWIHDSGISSPLYESLSVGGTDGTLKKMWTSMSSKGRVVGKSGYMKGVLGYAGYIHTNSNKKLAFCIIVNHFQDAVSQVRRNIEDIVEKIVVEY